MDQTKTEVGCSSVPLEPLVGRLKVRTFIANEDATVQIRSSDLDVILKPAPTPAEKLAEALCATYAPDGDEPAWTSADVLAALDAAGLTLAERADA